MKHIFFMMLAWQTMFSHLQAQTFPTTYEISKGTATATYEEVIDFYKKLDQHFVTVKMEEVGATDVMYPLHVVYYSKEGNFDIKAWKREEKTILFINNGIHPGEPDGIDASMMLLRDAAIDKINIPDNIVLAVIPVFNIGGAINRGSYSRANQNGPKAYGFRGNAQNLDLNRDFIKMDAKETQSLVRLFHQLNPDLFIDNHVSNGADYQHVMTLLTTHPQKQGDYLGEFLAHKMQPAIYAAMKEKGYDLVPYVNHWGHTPDKGWKQFYDPPRFASGFAALFGTLAFVPETHMLKPYKQRVLATYELMHVFITYAAQHAEEIKKARKKEREAVEKKQAFVIDWNVDTSLQSTISFKGYEAKYKPSEVSGKPRLYYDQTKPYTKQIPFYNVFKPSQTAKAPQCYIIPQGWHKVISRLKINGVYMKSLEKDSTIKVTVYRITDYEISLKPYEGHYLHRNVKYTKTSENILFRKGDYIIPLQQMAKRYLIETLEPDAPDAFFAWNFFDAILQQKEHFSDYVFEDEAARLLKENPLLKQKLEAKKKTDAAFAENGSAQLEFIYQHSPYQEPEYMRYPVYRME